MDPIVGMLFPDRRPQLPSSLSRIAMLALAIIALVLDSFHLFASSFVLVFMIVPTLRRFLVYSATISARILLCSLTAISP